MKKIIYLVAVSSFAFIPPRGEVKIRGSLKLSKTVEWVYLAYRTPDGPVSDSVKPQDGGFILRARTMEPVLATLSVKFETEPGQKRATVERMPLFIEPGTIKITAKDSLKFAVVTGSASHKEYMAISEMLKPFRERSNELSRQYRTYREAKDEEGMNKTEARMDSLDKEIKEKVYHNYLISNPGSPLALFALKQYAGYAIDPGLVEPLFASLPAAVRQWPSAIEFAGLIDAARKTSVGAPAMDFTQNDTLGKPVSLSSFRGKYVLIDFWASWCGPCRAENPNVVKAFRAYKDRGFTVLGVSLDQPGKQQAWLDAIHKDELTWTHVSDLNFWDNAVAKQYGIRAIPQNFLLDPDGKIVAKNIRGDELQKKLDELIK